MGNVYGGVFRILGRDNFIRVLCKIGGALRTQRQRQTVSPLTWFPPYLGSQKSLVPDIVR